MQQLLIDVLQEPFPQILKKTVLDPVGMVNSTYEQPLPQNHYSHAAIAHRMNGKPIKGNWHTYPEMAAAGLWTTPTDLCRFALEIMFTYLGKSQKIFSQDMVKDMLTVIDGNYGMGFSLRTAGGKLRFGHGGSNEGYRCTLAAWLKKGEGVAIMTNGDNGSHLMTEILGSLARVYDWPDFMPSERKVISLPSEALESYTGTYKFEPFGELTLTQKNGRLYVDKIYVSAEGKTRVEMFPTSETTFIATVTEAHINFRKDDTGKISGLTLVERGRKRSATKIEKPAKSHKLSKIINGFHLYSYYAGTAFMAAEVVSYDCKQLALSPPYTEAELAIMLKPTQMAADEYGLPIYVEKDFLTTKLFDEEQTQGKIVILIARNQEVIDKYFELKEFKKAAVAKGNLHEVEEELAWRFGRLLSYSDEAIRRLLARK